MQKSPIPHVADIHQADLPVGTMNGETHPTKDRLDKKISVFGQ